MCWQVIERHYGRSLGVEPEVGLWTKDGMEVANYTEPAGVHPSVIMYWSLSVAIFSVGGMVSSFLVGFAADYRGR